MQPTFGPRTRTGGSDARAASTVRPSRLLVLAVGVFGLSIPIATAANETATAGTAELRHRSLRKWDLQLPAEKLTPVGQGFSLEETIGKTFKVELEGTSLKIDSDGDGTFDVTAESPEAAVTLNGTEGRRYAVRLIDRGGWHYTAGGTLRGKIAGETIQLIDQNLDGDYCDIGEDAIIVGRGKIAAFLSQVIAIDGTLYELEVAADGTTVDYRPYRGATGTLTLGPCDTKAKVLSAVVRSEDGRFCFDMAKEQSGLTVPAGEYRLLAGIIGLGENRVTMQGGRSKSFTVPPGGTKELSWGGPVKAEFAYRHSGTQIDLSPEHVWYYGAAGELYAGWTPIGKSPEFTIRNKKTGREIAQAYFPGTC